MPSDPYVDQFGTDAPLGWDEPDGPEPVRHPFTNPVGDPFCVLVVPPGGKLLPLRGEPKTGVEHPGCAEVADLCLGLDAWYCPACRSKGRISGAWAAARIGEAKAAEAVSAK